MLSTQPITILREALQYLEHQRVMAPGYRFLQDLISRVVTGERRRITDLLGQAMTPAIEQRLAALLQADEGMYRISELKHEPKDFSYKALRQEAARRKAFQPLYAFARGFLASAALSNESVKYYASLVQFYTVYKLQRMATGVVRLYLLCFAHHRFRQINDNLIEAFIHLLDQYEEDAKELLDPFTRFVSQAQFGFPPCCSFFLSPSKTALPTCLLSIVTLVSVHVLGSSFALHLI
jgi:hypothetical protein